jgi:hypothetical protein
MRWPRKFDDDKDELSYPQSGNIALGLDPNSAIVSYSASVFRKLHSHE